MNRNIKIVQSGDEHYYQIYVNNNPLSSTDAETFIFKLNEKIDVLKEDLEDFNKHIIKLETERSNEKNEIKQRETEIHTILDSLEKWRSLAMKRDREIERLEYSLIQLIKTMFPIEGEK